MKRRERDLNSRTSLSNLLQLLESEAKAALADASEMNMKTAMDLLKTLAGGIE